MSRKQESDRTQRRREERKQQKELKRIHNGQHGLDCSECKKWSFEEIGNDHELVKNGVHLFVNNPHIPMKQIRDYLGFGDKVNYYGKEHGKRISLDKIKNLVNEYGEYLKAS